MQKDNEYHHMHYVYYSTIQIVNVKNVIVYGRASVKFRAPMKYAKEYQLCNI